MTLPSRKGEDAQAPLGIYRAAADPERMAAVRVARWHAGAVRKEEDLLAAEEPLEIRVDGTPLAVIMRTPGHDDELAAGFLHGEGIIQGRDDLAAVDVWRDERGVFAENVVTIRPHTPAALAPRQFYASSSCGICGKASVEAALQLAPPLPRRIEVGAAILYDLPAKLRAAQPVFAHTGGLHAAGLFTLDGELLLAREDVGRHNAVDKLIGRRLLDGTLPLNAQILLVSGRISFEIVQKALVAQIPLIAAISAPSSLAVQTAQRANMVLAGFLRADRVNIYT